MSDLAEKIIDDNAQTKSILTTRKAINPAFKNFLNNYTHTYQLLFGGYGSSKSYNTALKVIIMCLSEKRTVLAVRNVFETLRDSSFALIKEIAENMGLTDDLIKFKTSPIGVYFPSTQSQILFKGMDNPDKIKSILDPSIIWLEECSEIRYSAFKELTGRLRHPKLDLFMFLTTNPVSKSSWVYEHFFLNKKLDDNMVYEKKYLALGDTFYHHSTVADNLFVTDAYRKRLDESKEYDYDYWLVARMGRFGNPGTTVLPNFEVMPHHMVLARLTQLPIESFRVGMDFGFEKSYTAVLRTAVDDVNKYLYIYWEYYVNQKTDDKVAYDLRDFITTQELIRCDSASASMIKYMQNLGFKAIQARKYQGSKADNVRKVKRFRKIICSDKCVSTISELKDLTFKKDKNDNIYPDEFNIDPHTFSAIWYALDGYEVSNLKSDYYFGRLASI